MNGNPVDSSSDLDSDFDPDLDSGLDSDLAVMFLLTIEANPLAMSMSRSPAPFSVATEYVHGLSKALWTMIYFPEGKIQHRHRIFPQFFFLSDSYV